MAFLTTNPSPFIINQPELTNVITSATGFGSLSNSVTDILSYVNTGNASVSVNTLGSFNTSAITVTNNLNLSNAGVFINNAPALNATTVNGTPFLSLTVGQTEQARLTTTGLGIKTPNPIAACDVNGNTVVRGALFVSSMGAAVTSTLGYVYADGDVYARSILYPSDPKLKTSVAPYKYTGVLPTPVSFQWIRSGAHDIGVLADEVEAIEPACVSRNARGERTVDYPKLVVLCLAELHVMRSTIASLNAKLSEKE